MHIILNGKILPADKAFVSIHDRGFKFGDGVFETCLIENGIIYNWEAHSKRLKGGLAAIKIKADISKLSNDCQQLIIKNKIKSGILRIAISRGVGSLGYLPTDDIKPTIVIETLNHKSKLKLPIKLTVSSYTKPSLKSLPVNYKLANGLNSVLAKIEANEKGFFDAIILNEKNQICETSSANIFWIKDDVLYAPHLDCGCLEGTIREKIIKLSPIKIKLAKAKLSDLLKADEVFITNASLGVVAINEIAKKKFTNKKYVKIFADLLIRDIQNYVR